VVHQLVGVRRQGAPQGTNQADEVGQEWRGSGTNDGRVVESWEFRHVVCSSSGWSGMDGGGGGGPRRGRWSEEDDDGGVLQ
jgi:hypothetical protein